jgi:hypothetical protein
MESFVKQAIGKSNAEYRMPKETQNQEAQSQRQSVAR